MSDETRSTRRRFLRNGTLLGVVGTGLLAGCSSGGDGDGDGGGGGGENTVDMTDDLAFDPETITVSVGDTVTWDNVGTVAHTVTAYDDGIPDGADYFASGGFGSEQAARDGYPGEGTVESGETYSHTFETAGTYEYFCIPHESSGMKGTVEVTEE